MTNSPQIVHESETQRQFIRLQLPAMATIDGTRFTVKDLSSGGMAIRDIGTSYKKGDIKQILLTLPFGDFSLDVEIKGEIQHIDKKLNIAGCRFTDLTSNQISILNHVIKSFMSGDIVGTEDLLNVVSRENFVNVRKHNNDTASLKDNVTKYGIYGLIILATLMLSAFIINNIFEKTFIIKTPYGYVHADTLDILSPASGVYTSALTIGTASVQKGQVIGYIDIAGGASDSIEASETIQITQSKKIISPCDCFISETHILEGKYSPQNAKLFTFLPQDSEITIRADVPTEDIRRLQVGMSAIANISGVIEGQRGEITDIIVNQKAVSTEQQATALVVIKPEKKLNNDLINHPAFVEFKL